METNNNLGALSEIDRLGQGVLDALWAEEAAYSHKRQQVTELMDDKRAGADARDVMHQLAALLEVPTEHEALMRIVEIMQTGNARKAAVEKYVMARRLLTQAGVL